MSRAVQPRSFVYVASRAGGRPAVGVRLAGSERALSAALRRERMSLRRCVALPSWVSVEGEVGLRDLTGMNEQLAALVSRGVPLVDALEVVRTVVSRGQQGRVERIREAVASGAGFAEACERAGGFDRVTVGIYRAAERTGDLAQAASQLATNAKRRLAVSGKAATLAVYPTIVLTVGVSASIGLVTGVVPTIGRSLAASGLDLPPVTVAVMGVGLWIRANWGWMVLGLVGAVLGGLVLRRGVGRAAGWVSRRVPLLREVLVTQDLVQFFSVMTAMTRSGVPLADALATGAGAVKNPRLREELARLRTRLVQGGILGSLIDEVRTFPMATRRLLVAADRAGDLESAFEGLSEDMAAALETRTTRLLAALEPLMLVGLFVLVGGLLVSVMLPVLTLAARQI